MTLELGSRSVYVIRDDMDFYDNETASFTESHEFVFDPENNLPESTVITTLNVPLMVGMDSARA